MKEIRGDAKNIRALLGGAKYAVDYYQREYKWQKKHVAELLDDLSDKFRESYDSGHERSAVESYGHYFLGSIIISDKEGRKFIIDGQQRLTSLTLLLIFLHRRSDDHEQKGQLAELIFSQRFGQRSFNLDVPERSACMEALYAGQMIEESGQPESVKNIISRYHEIEDLFPDDLTAEALPFFTDWLIENVHLVEITAYSDEDAYTIFETMNDRGLSLTATDMLKGYLLANIPVTADRNQASAVWRERISSLQAIGKEEDSDAIKGWLRSQHADSIRERKPNAVPRDFDLIGTEFHRWVRDNEKSLGLKCGADFAQFIERDFAFYARQYRRIREAAATLTVGLEHIHYNAQNNFTLQYPVLLAPLRVDDTEPEILKKLRITAAFLDILITRRIWNFRAIDYSTLSYTMFTGVMKAIRGKSSPEIAEILSARLADETETFASNDRLRIHGTNGRQIHRLLARMTEFVEISSGMPSHYSEYVQRRTQKGYEVEHIWANHSDRHSVEFPHASDFEEYRNRLGDLLLLPKSFNASYGDLPYEEKLPYYLTQNLLARSLHPQCYDHNPGFLRFISETKLPFKPHTTFRRTDLDERHDLYRQLAERIWDPAILQVHGLTPDRDISGN
jgi:hypothetical protein